MALDFTITTANSTVAVGVAQVVTIALTGTGTLVSLATFTGTGTGTASAAPTLAIGQGAGASTSFTWIPTATGVLTVTATGGLTQVHTLSFTLARPNTVSAQMLIDQAAGILGVKSPGESVNPNEAADWLLRLNMLIDGWRTESLYAYSSQLVTATLKGQVKSMTIGPSGDIVVPYRPIRIEDGSYFTTSGLDYPLASFTETRYNQLAYKTIGTIGPDGVYYRPDLPNGTLYFYPQSGGDVTLSLLALVELVEFPDLVTLYVLAPGYRRALSYALAEEMAPDYMRPSNPMVSQTAALAKRNIKRANHQTPALGPTYTRGNILVGWEL